MLTGCSAQIQAGPPAAPVAAKAAEENPHVWKPRIRSVAVFKNGLGFFMREGETQLRDGWCVAEQVPPAAFGTLAIYSRNDNETVDIVGSGPGEVVEFDGRLESIALGQLLRPRAGRLVQRAESSGMEIVVAGEPSARQQCVRANVSAVEQILFNLIDNACKYASAAEDKRIHVGRCGRCWPAGDSRLRPWSGHSFRTAGGAGSAASQNRARRRPRSAPGIGLGLAVSRRLARHIGGECDWSPAKARGLASCWH